MTDKQWRPIDSAPVEERILVWCADPFSGDMKSGPVFGRAFQRHDGSKKVVGDTLFGDWSFSHWMPLPDPPNS